MAELKKKINRVRIRHEDAHEGIKAELAAESLEVSLSDDEQIRIGAKKHYLNNGSYAIIFKDAMLKLLDLDLNKAELKTIIYLLAKADQEGNVDCNSRKIAPVIGMDASVIRKALKKLKNYKIVVEVNDRMKINLEGYQIHPWTDFQVSYHLSYSGSLKNFGELLKIHPPLLQTNGEQLYSSPRLLLEKMKEKKIRPKKENHFR